MNKILISFSLVYALTALGNPAKVGHPAPDFTLPDHNGNPVHLNDRKGKGWTVLFFFPKAGTPGCTKQACAFRDSISVIRAKNAEVYGISADTVEVQKKFHESHKLLYTLLSDAKLEAINQYGVKMTGVDLAKRWTFIVDPQMQIRWVDDKVDPVMDPKHVTDKLTALQESKS